MWAVQTVQPTYQEAQYFLILESENKVLYANQLTPYSAPFEHFGDFASFVSMQGPDCPLIPVDTHTALSLNWVDMQRMVRNRPYLDETMKAAIALVA